MTHISGKTKVKVKARQQGPTGQQESKSEDVNGAELGAKVQADFRGQG